MVKKIFVPFCVLWVLTGCVAGQHLKLDHTPSEVQQEQTKGSVLVVVEDHRSYVVNRDKENYYIGHYRAGFGNPWDVTTFKKVPLKEQIRVDLVEELHNLGFRSSDSGNILSVEILEWNFDGYQNGRFWYEINLDVLDKGGKIVATKKLKDEIIIKGTVMGGAKSGFEREMPILYEKIIDDIVRSNTDILRALSS